MDVLLTNTNLSALAWPFTIMLALGVLWSWRKPYRFPLVMFFVLILLHAPPINTQFDSLALPAGSISIHITDLLLLGTILLGAKTFLFSTSSLYALKRIYWLTIASFLIWHLLRAGYDVAIAGKHPELVLRLLAGRAFILLAIFFPMFLYRQRRFSWKRIRLALLVIGAIIPLFAFINIVLYPQGLVITSSGTKRYLMGTTNIYMAFCLILVVAGFRARWFTAKTALIYSLWMLIGMALTQHRSIVVALGVIFIVDSLVTASASEKGLRISLAILATVALLAYAPILVKQENSIVGQVFTRIADTFDTSNTTSQGRLSKWQQRLVAIRENPWFGTGFGREAGEKRSRSLLNRQAGHEAHNFVISVLTYEGIVGLAINGWLILLLLRHSWSLTKIRRQGYEIPFFFLVFFLVYSLFNTTYFNPLAAPAFFATAGIIAYLNKLHQTRKVAISKHVEAPLPAG